MDLCKLTYDTLLSHPRQDKVVQIIPEQIDGQLLVIHEAESIDIGIPKQIYYGIFKQAHDYWHSQRSKFTGDLTEISTQTLMEMYIVSVSYLLTANDHHMMVNCHEMILIELYHRDSKILITEFEIISTLVSSRMAKINKNSLIWHMMKKLSILLIFESVVECQGLNEVLMVRLFRSTKYHYANYYANNFIAWFMDMNRIYGRDNKPIVDELLVHCHENLKDVSLWTNVKKYIDNECRIYDEYNLMINDINQKFRTKYDPKLECRVMDIDTTFVVEELEWLFKVKCVSKPPYISLLTNDTRDLILRQVEWEKNQLKTLNNQSLFYETQLQYIDTLQYVCNVKI